MRKLIFLLYMLCAFNIFKSTPLDFYTNIFLVILSVYGIYLFFIKGYYTKPHTLLIFILILLVIGSSIYASITNLNQETFASIFATSNIFFCYSIFVPYYWIRTNKIDLENSFKQLIYMSWVFACLITIISISGFSYQFISSNSGVNDYLTINKISTSLIFFAIIWYLIQFQQKKSVIYFVFSLVLLIITQINDIQRGDVLVISVIFVTLLIVDFSRVQKLNSIITVPIFICFTLLLLISTDLTFFSDKFTQLYAALFNTTEELKDFSLLVRFNELQFALKGFYESLLIGNGLILSSLKKSLIGNIYFYPSDVGLAGILYCFGLFGIFLYIWSCFNLFKIFSNRKISIVTRVMVYYLLFQHIYCIKDGNVLFKPLLILLFFIQMHYFNELNIKKKLVQNKTIN